MLGWQVDKEDLGKKILHGKSNDEPRHNCRYEFFPLEFFQTPNCNGQKYRGHPAKANQPELKRYDKNKSRNNHQGCGGNGYLRCIARRYNTGPFLSPGGDDDNQVSRTRFPWTQNWLNRSVQGGPEHDRQF